MRFEIEQIEVNDVLFTSFARVKGFWKEAQ